MRVVRFFADVPGWAFTRVFAGLAKHLPYYCVLNYTTPELSPINCKESDVLIVPSIYQIFNYGVQVETLFKQHADKLCLILSSHEELKNCDSLSWPKQLAARSQRIAAELSSGCRRTIAVLGNGVDTNLFQPSSVLQTGKLRVGWVGNALLTTKRYHVAEQWVASTNHTFVPVGRGIRYCENMVDYYQSIDVLLSTSTTEGDPNPQLEAAACGVPSISAVFSSMPSWFNSTTGFSGEIDLASLTREECLRRGRNARDAVAVRSWKRVVETEWQPVIEGMLK